jgi:hypothetical protein
MHQTATTQKLTTIPAELPEITTNSQLTRRKPIKTLERIGAKLAPKFQIKKEARIMLPMVRIIQSMCAGPHGSNAKGTVKENEVGG